jgi:hypothetical protein
MAGTYLVSDISGRGSLAWPSIGPDTPQDRDTWWAWWTARGVEVVVVHVLLKVPGAQSYAKPPSPPGTEQPWPMGRTDRAGKTSALPLHLRPPPSSPSISVANQPRRPVNSIHPLRRAGPLPTSQFTPSPRSLPRLCGRPRPTSTTIGRSRFILHRALSTSFSAQASRTNVGTPSCPALWPWYYRLSLSSLFPEISVHHLQ